MADESKIYRNRAIWNLVLLIAAILIGIGSLVYTNTLIDDLKDQEKEIVRHWAEATGLVATTDGDEVLSFLLSIIENNRTIPVIWVDSADNIKSFVNFNLPRTKDPDYIKTQLEKLKETSVPIDIDIGNGDTDYIYYKESTILTRLIFYPYIQLIIITIFIVVAYIAFSISRTAEQNQVWMGLSKETAHQLGTPTSSLAGWAELMKQEFPDHQITKELGMDVGRLEKITERFSKIGSVPELRNEDLSVVISKGLEYLRSRAGSKVEFIVRGCESSIYVPLNTLLFEWVLENICKNAIDAMGGEGSVTISLTAFQEKVFVDIADNGRGIPKSEQKRIFKPGYTSKERGWGLGLSLAKRIIESYHKGRIFVKHSDPGVGSLFRIVLHR